MKTNLLALVLTTVCVLGAAGCSSEPAQATPEQVKNFGGGPPPANYMDKANATASVAEKNATNQKNH